MFPFPTPCPHHPFHIPLDQNGLSLTPVQLPFYALMSLASYLLFKLGWGVFTFRDVPDAHKELMAEIETAREDLKKKGIDVD